MIWCIEIVFFVCVNFSAVPIFSLEFGAFLLINYFTEDITNDLCDLDVIEATTSPLTSQQFHQNVQEIKIHLRNVVQIYGDTKELSVYLK